MQLQVPINLDEFVWTAVEERSTSERLDAARFVAQACAYYASELGRRRIATTVPRLGDEEGGGESRTLTFELDEATLTRLRGEAERQDVALERLVAHAVIFYLADEDAGRVAERVARRARAIEDQTG
jgi:hypothetical protein